MENYFIKTRKNFAKAMFVSEIKNDEKKELMVKLSIPWCRKA